MTCKIVPEMTYNVSSGTLSLYTTTPKAGLGKGVTNGAQCIMGTSLATAVHSSLTIYDLSHGAQLYRCPVKRTHFTSYIIAQAFHIITQILNVISVIKAAARLMFYLPFVC